METATMTAATRRQRRAAERRMRSGLQKCAFTDILFDVETRTEELESNTEYAYRIIGKVNGKDKLLNQCSKVYQLVKNEEIFPNIISVLENFIVDGKKIDYKANFYHIGNVRFYAEFIITDKRYSYKMKGTNDEIMPVLKVQHSYNGKTKYRIIFGYYRLICTNGLMVAVEEMKEFNLCIVGKHTESIKKSFLKLDAMLRNFTENATSITDKLIDKYEMLGGRWVAKLEDRITEVLKATKISMIDTSKFNTLNYIKGKVKEESTDKRLGYKGKVNDWLIYNAINQYINDNDRNVAIPEKRMEIDSKVLEYMLAN
jgi:hypothetical protein